MLRFSILNFLALFLISCSSGCAYFQLESAMLNQKRKSIALVSSMTFMRITNTSTNAIIIIETSTSPKPKDTLISFSTAGSSSIIKHKKNATFILTAAHVCKVVYRQQISSIFPPYDPKNYKVMSSRINTIFDIEGKNHIAIPLVWNVKYDVCIMVTKRIDHPAINLSFRPPTHGQKIYYLGFPRGIGGGQFVPIFDGYYLGTKKIGRFSKRHKTAAYSIPIAPGSSGSAVIDEHGNLVGMLHSYYVRFDNLGLSATHEQLKELLDKADKFWAKKRDEFLKELNPSL